MKKIISLVLMLVLIFSLSVTSFAYDSVSVTNWPTYFTGAYDHLIYGVLENILDEIDVGLHSIDGTVYDIYSILFNNVEISQERWNVLEEYLAGINGSIVSLGLDMWDIYDNLYQDFEYDWIPSLTSSISGVTRSVDNLTQEFSLEFDPRSGTGSAGYSLYMLQQVLADEDDLAMKNQNAGQKDEITNFAFAGISGYLGSSVSYLNSGSISIDTLTSFFDYFDTGFDGYLFFYFFDIDDPWIWFSGENDVSINGVQTYSRSRNEPQVVTNYYEQNREELLSILKGAD